ncbi:MAG TPA: hypothetical protein VIL78_11810 [Hanamia sp.]
MHEEKKFLALLQVTVPPDTALTVNSELKILVMLGIVSNPELVSSIEIAGTLIPPSTPATLHGLIVLLGNLIKKHPKATKAHNDAVANLIKNFTDVPDAVLTYGTFLPICEALMKAVPHKFTKAEIEAAEKK